jgi:uridine kinase
VQPFLIGVAGPSGAGKSELSRLIASRLPGPTARVSLDSYYRALSHLPFEERSKCNFDHPDSLDWDLIRADVDRLHHGEPIDEPVYLFDRHSRAEVTRRIEPVPFIILEGLFALYDEPVRSLLDARIFVVAPDEVCLKRRLARDTVERGRTEESVLRQYAETVRPMAELFVRPTREFADLVVSGIEPLETSWALCRDFLLQAA